MDKQIEEMAKDIANSGVFMVTDSNTIARVVINLGYRKIPENAVVLTREEYKAINLDKAVDMLREIQSQARKETAEKFAERLKFKLEKHTRKIMREDYQQGAYIYMVESSDIETCIDEICKEISEGK